MTPALLADACALIAFYGLASSPLTARGLAAMQGEEVAISAITVWEITRKVAAGKLPPVPGLGGAGFAAHLRGEGFRLLDLTAEVAERANALPMHHADPMDRMLIATALAGGMTIITSDRVFAAYGVGVIW